MLVIVKSEVLYIEHLVYFIIASCVLFMKRKKIITNDTQRKYTKNKIPVLGGTALHKCLLVTC